MISEEKIVEKLAKAASELASLLVVVVCQAAATATDPFFRKNFGERYFTSFRVFLSWVGWGTAASIAFRDHIHQPNQIPLVVLITACVFQWGYLIMAIFHLRAIRRRQTAGVVWHSKSGGESIFGSENAIRDFIIEIVVTVGLYFISLPLCIFFALSRFLGYVADAMAWQRFYNRYLDIQDAKIDGEFMEAALSEGLAPRKTSGLYRPMPKRFKGEHRANVARVVATGEFGSASPNAQQSTPLPSDEWPVVGRFLLSLLRSKRFRYCFAIILIIVATYSWGIPYIRKLVARTKQSSANIEEGRQMAAFPSTPTPAQAAPSATTSELVSSPNTVSTPTPPVSASATPPSFPIVARDSVTVTQPVVTEEARRKEREDQATLERQKREEQEKQQVALKTQELENRKRNLAQLENTVTNQIAQIKQFKVDCGETITNRIRQFGIFDSKGRRAFKSRAEEAQVHIRTVIDNQKVTLGGWLKTLENNATVSADALQHQIDELPGKAESMQKERHQITDEIKTLVESAGKP